MRPCFLFALILSTLFARSAHADQDYGDNVSEYTYVLRFDPSDLIKFDSFIVVTRTDDDEEFEILKRLGDWGKRDSGTGNGNDYVMSYVGHVPKVIWGIPSASLASRVASWINSKSATTKAGDKYALITDENQKEFQDTFGKEAVRLLYIDSPVLKQLLDLAPGKEHFIAAKGATLKLVTEKLKVERSGTEGRLIQTGYEFEYSDRSPVNLSPQKVSKMARPDFKRLIDAMPK